MDSLSIKSAKTSRRIKPIRFEPGDLEGPSRQGCHVHEGRVVWIPGHVQEDSQRRHGEDYAKLTSGARRIERRRKTTLLKLLIWISKPTKASARCGVTNLRLSYIAQHSMQHLEDSLENTPLEYLQNRFYQGRDKEIAKRASHNLSKDELASPRAREHFGHRRSSATR